MEKNDKIYVAGHRGLVGSAIIRNLQNLGYNNLIVRTHEQLELINQHEVDGFFSKFRPDYVFLAAARVGGILENQTYPADFIYSNLMVQTNVIHSAYKYGVKKLLFLGSSCIYPKLAPQPLKEEYLLTNELEKSNEAYAIAKIAGLKMCEYYNKQYNTDFISVMPTNLYGSNDNFNLDSGHVLPALIRRFHEAKINGKSEVMIWGTGSARRELMYVDEMVSVCIYLMQRYSAQEIGDFVNIGTGVDITIRELAELVADVVGFNGKITNDLTKSDGMPQKLLDLSKLHSLGWVSTVSLREGLKQTYEWYLENYDKNEVRK
jgi:GDP-L-fucose synthase